MKGVLVTVLALTSFPMMGQWGLRMGAQGEKIIGRTDLCFLVGVDHDMGDRNSLGLDYSLRVNLSGEEYNTESFEKDGYTGYYYMSRGNSGLTLRSQFFFNDEGGVYLGPFVGYRSVQLHIYTQVNDDYSGITPSWAKNRSVTTTLIPLGMRIGARSVLDGLFMDAYFGIGTNLGDRTGLDADYLLAKDEIKSLYLQFGLCYGIGWD